MVSITVPNAAALTGNTSIYTGPMTYVFDAVLKLSHEQRIEKTRHPVQTGADVSSHAFIMPARLTLYVGMSDAMDAYAAAAPPSQILPYEYPNYVPFTGADSKSVSAFQTMLSIQKARQPLTVTTRLRTYGNMLIMALEPEEDSRTITGLRMRVELEQILTAAATPVVMSARQNDTESTGLGQTNVEAPDPTTTKQFNVDTAAQQGAGIDQPTSNLLGWLRQHPSGVDVPGAGTYSSVNASNLANTPAPTK
jgi:hypothetical protein